MEVDDLGLTLMSEKCWYMKEEAEATVEEFRVQGWTGSEEDDGRLSWMLIGNLLFEVASLEYYRHIDSLIITFII